METKDKISIFNFWRKLFSILIVVGAIHYSIIFYKEYSADLFSFVVSYLINGFLAGIIYTTLIFLKKKYSDQMGFMFMGGSFLKFIIFFVVLQPIYKADGIVNSIELSSFLIPYFICLLYETIFLIKILNYRL